MYSHETKIRVRYGETDAMGIVYYGVYPMYYESGRTEMLRNLGFTYREMEEGGIIMPVISMNCQYKQPARYDDLLTVKTILSELPTTRITFDYEIFSDKNILLNKGNTTLVFVDRVRNRPVKAPDFLINAIKTLFK